MNKGLSSHWLFACYLWVAGFILFFHVQYKTFDLKMQRNVYERALHQLSYVNETVSQQTFLRQDMPGELSPKVLSLQAFIQQYKVSHFSSQQARVAWLSYLGILEGVVFIFVAVSFVRKNSWRTFFLELGVALWTAYAVLYGIHANADVSFLDHVSYRLWEIDSLFPQGHPQLSRHVLEKLFSDFVSVRLYLVLSIWGIFYLIPLVYGFTISYKDK